MKAKLCHFLLMVDDKKECQKPKIFVEKIWHGARSAYIGVVTCNILGPS